MSNSENGRHITELAATRTPSARLRLDEIVRSDALADLSEFRKHNPMLKQVIEEPLQIRLVLDANIVQRELRWRLKRRATTLTTARVNNIAVFFAHLPISDSLRRREDAAARMTH
jgi:hypothetical protein